MPSNLVIVLVLMCLWSCNYCGNGNLTSTVTCILTQFHLNVLKFVNSVFQSINISFYKKKYFHFHCLLCLGRVI